MLGDCFDVADRFFCFVYIFLNTAWTEYLGLLIPYVHSQKQEFKMNVNVVPGMADSHLSILCQKDLLPQANFLIGLMDRMSTKLK